MPQCYGYENNNFNPLPPCGGRPALKSNKDKALRISIHSLRAEGDLHHPILILQQLPFQSTPSVRRETMESTNNITVCHLFQSTPSVRRETVSACAWAAESMQISIHSLRAEGDCYNSSYGRCDNKNFNPLPPCGGRPHCGTVTEKKRNYFNPLPPCGGRLKQPFNYYNPLVFQSTPSVRRETMK